MYMSCRIAFYNRTDILRLLLKYKKWIQLYEDTENIYSVQEVIEHTIFKETKKAKNLKMEKIEQSEEEEDEEDDEWEEEEEEEVEEEEENEDDEDPDFRKIKESEEEWDEEWEEKDDDFIVNDGKSVDFEKEINRLTREDEFFEMKNKRKLRRRKFYPQVTEEKEEEEDSEEEVEEDEEKDDEDEQQQEYREINEEYEEKKNKLLRNEKFEAEKEEESFSSSNISASKNKKRRRIQKLSCLNRKGNYITKNIPKNNFDKEKNRDFSLESLHEQSKKARGSTKKHIESKNFHKFESFLGKRKNKYSSPASSDQKNITEKQDEFSKYEYDCSEKERKRNFRLKLRSDSGSSEQYFEKKDARKKIKLENDCETVVSQAKDDFFYVIIDTESPTQKKGLKNIDGMKRLKRIIID